MTHTPEWVDPGLECKPSKGAKVLSVVLSPGAPHHDESATEEVCLAEGCSP